ALRFCAARYKKQRKRQQKQRLEKLLASHALLISLVFAFCYTIRAPFTCAHHRAGVKPLFPLFRRRMFCLTASLSRGSLPLWTWKGYAVPTRVNKFSGD